MKLFEIATQYQSLMQEIMDCDELNKEQLNAIESINDSLEDKAKAVGAFIKNMEADYKSITDAMDAMKKRASTLESKIDCMKEYLKSNLERCNVKEVKSPWFDIKIKLNPESVLVNDETIIPSEYFKETLLRKLDKGLISQGLKNNIMIPGVMLERRTRIEIK